MRLPGEIDEADVERSNRIMLQLAKTARVFPANVERLAKLPMHAVAEVAGQRIGIVHGDAESLWLAGVSRTRHCTNPKIKHGSARFVWMQILPGLRPRTPACSRFAFSSAMANMRSWPTTARPACQIFVHAIWIADAAFSAPAH